MKVAIPVESDSGLNVPVAKEIERAPYFVVVSLKGEEAEVNVYENVPAKEKKPGLIPEMLSALGVKKIVTGEMGTRLRILFEHYRIEVETGVSGTLEEVVRKILSSSASQS
ncbi:NifB/NifX family molybdenum-iron cluster-binding protein [Phorcysia thermohydrogeniphila]|uniref:Putative Fe-Mo cluster-binding NifX family protein n=1 Tax=Phorcysia thermohydrogeniphila TaxID=936138 RepID=A0A4R1GH04_9BACT|nr:NifB/NifX family molybdenum-iron cluster-binding protein [Phorcysia thermohydrogeniphila]TCK06230.1 putative Fe-Mo cluster-binding NifX family protein [Phorcysia thermohydrogeniphila]